MTSETPWSRQAIEAWMRSLQDQICAGVEDIEHKAGEGAARFVQDSWERPGGGGGRSRVIEQGAVFEKAGVNFSQVHGEMDAKFAAQVPGSGTEFFATGVSLVIHPKNPHVPTCHANFRYIEKGERAWFGGGADLTPYYFQPEDRAHFHAVWKQVCDKHPQVADYPAFSEWCDRYFYLSHRKERRGVGGIFFDDLVVDTTNPKTLGHAQRVYDFVRDAGTSFLAAYMPIVQRRQSTPYTPAQRDWQQIRRGRYVEFNLVHDRGTTFGLRTNGRIESILMSLPPSVQWRYNHEPEPNTPEARLLEELRIPPPPAPKNGDQARSSDSA